MHAPLKQLWCQWDIMIIRVLHAFIYNDNRQDVFHLTNFCSEHRLRYKTNLRSVSKEGKLMFSVHRCTIYKWDAGFLAVNVQFDGWRSAVDEANTITAGSKPVTYNLFLSQQTSLSWPYCNIVIIWLSDEASKMHSQTPYPFAAICKRISKISHCSCAVYAIRCCYSCNTMLWY